MFSSRVHCGAQHQLKDFGTVINYSATGLDRGNIKMAFSSESILLFVNETGSWKCILWTPLSLPHHLITTPPTPLTSLSKPTSPLSLGWYLIFHTVILSIHCTAVCYFDGIFKSNAIPGKIQWYLGS